MRQGLGRTEAGSVDKVCSNEYKGNKGTLFFKKKEKGTKLYLTTQVLIKLQRNVV